MQVVAHLSYEKLKEIGAGQGMNSKVYLAKEPQLGGTVVVKEIDNSSLINPDFFAEAQVMYSASHPNVVPIRYACQSSTCVSLVMPFFRRGSLARRIEAAPITCREAIRVAVGVLSGVSHIHRAGYVHFDVKPSNILFSDADEPMLADFGQSRRVNSRGVVVSVPRLYYTFMPPEAITHGVGLPESDVYQTGLTLYRMVNGDPFYSTQIPSNHTVLCDQIRLGKFPDRSDFLPHVPDRFRRAIRKAMEVDPGDRFRSATEMASELGKIRVLTDWRVVPLSGISGWEWRAERVGRPALIARLALGNAGYVIEFFTEAIHGSRRSRDKHLWVSQVAYSEACRRLRRWFKAQDA